MEARSCKRRRPCNSSKLVEESSPMLLSKLLKDVPDVCDNLVYQSVKSTNGPSRQTLNKRNTKTDTGLSGEIRKSIQRDTSSSSHPCSSDKQTKMAEQSVSQSTDISSSCTPLEQLLINNKPAHSLTASRVLPSQSNAEPQKHTEAGTDTASRESDEKSKRNGVETVEIQASISALESLLQGRTSNSKSSRCSNLKFEISQSTSANSYPAVKEGIPRQKQQNIENKELTKPITKCAAVQDRHSSTGDLKSPEDTSVMENKSPTKKLKISNVSQSQCLTAGPPLPLSFLKKNICKNQPKSSAGSKRTRDFHTQPTDMQIEYFRVRARYLRYRKAATCVVMNDIFYKDELSMLDCNPSDKCVLSGKYGDATMPGDWDTYASYPLCKTD